MLLPLHIRDRQNEVPCNVYLTVEENLPVKCVKAVASVAMLLGLFYFFARATRTTRYSSFFAVAAAVPAAAYAVFVIFAFTKGRRSVRVSYALDLCACIPFVIVLCGFSAASPIVMIKENLYVPENAILLWRLFAAGALLTALYAAAAAAVYRRLGKKYPLPEQGRSRKTDTGLLFLLLPAPVFAVGIFAAAKAFSLSANDAVSLALTAAVLWLSLITGVSAGRKTAIYRSWRLSDGAAEK
jgi:hypothetical protein